MALYKCVYYYYYYYYYNKAGFGVLHPTQLIGHAARLFYFYASVGKAIMLSRAVHSSGQILLPRYLTNSLSNLDETYSEYSLAPPPTDDLVTF